MLRASQKGFTLVEVLITMAIGMIILAGMVSAFVSQTNVANMMKGKTEAMGDLFLASQIMQAELRGAQAICVKKAGGTTVLRLAYQPLDSTKAITGCSTASQENGSFELVKKAKDDYRIYWKRPTTSRAEEFIRGMMPDPGYVLRSGENAAPDGLMVSDPASPDASLRGNSDTWVVKLSSRYLDQNKKISHLDLKFKVWPRN